MNGLKINWCGYANGGNSSGGRIVPEAFLGVNLSCYQGLCQFACVYSTNTDHTWPFIFLNPTISPAFYEAAPGGYGDHWNSSDCRQDSPEKCQFLVVETTYF